MRFKQAVLIEKTVNCIPEPDSKIIILETPFISYPEIQSSENFQVYFNSVLRSKHVLRTRIKIMPYQQSFETNVGLQSLVANFVGGNRQFAFLELSLF